MSDLVERLRNVSPSTLGHVRDSGLIGGLTPIRRPIRLAGPAVTVRVSEIDANGILNAARAAAPGDVLVVSQPRGAGRACFGGVLASHVKALGLAGVVVDGQITDHEQLLELNLPVYHRGITPRVSHRSDRPATIGVPVDIDGVVITPGDVIFGDSDGLGVLSPFEVAEVLAELERREADEALLRQRMLA